MDALHPPGSGRKGDGRKGDGFIFEARWRSRDQTARALLLSIARPPAPAELDAPSDATFNFVGEPGAARQLTPLDRDPHDLPLAVAIADIRTLEIIAK